jgi:hypothetical protein
MHNKAQLFEALNLQSFGCWMAKVVFIVVALGDVARDSTSWICREAAGGQGK